MSRRESWALVVKEMVGKAGSVRNRGLTHIKGKEIEAEDMLK
jgi:hypothetical protein